MRDDIDLIWPRLESIADEVAATLVKTAFSHDVVECRDMAVAVCDEHGRLLAHSYLGATGHIGSVPGFMKAVLARYPAEHISDGDAFVSNDPWVASGHTPDVFIAVPVLHDARLAAFIVTAVHHADIGGRAGAGNVREIYEEGLLLPVLRMQREHEEVKELFDLIERNVRFGPNVIGDLRAQIASGNTGAHRLRELFVECDMTSLAEAGDIIVSRTETAMRRSIAELGVGTYSSTCLLDAVGSDGRPLQISLRLTISEDGSLTADFSGTSQQVLQPINCPLQYALAYVVVATKLACRADVPTNDGAYRAITVSAPEGTLLNPLYPAPVFWRLSVGLRVAEMILRCLHQAAPDRVPAESGSLPVWQFYVSGIRRSGMPFSMHQHAFGGMGARPARDGLDSVSFPYNVRDVSVEGTELESPIMITRRELRTDSGGAGRWRGGMGEVVVLTAAPDGDLDPGQPLVFSGGAGRFRAGPSGVNGGCAGLPGAVLVDGVPVPIEMLGNSPHVEFAAGQELTLLLPGGGGYGPVEQRPAEALVLDDADGVRAACGDGHPGHRSTSEELRNG
jgi:N-methylhydantoinase B